MARTSMATIAGTALGASRTAWARGMPVIRVLFQLVGVKRRSQRTEPAGLRYSVACSQSGTRSSYMSWPT
jgi:hypothetical protein